MADQTALGFLQDEKYEDFNRYVDRQGGVVDLTGAHLRSYDLRKCHLKQANLTGAYMRAADLRALDLSEATLDMASFKDAKISGALFPRNISAWELMLSLEHGTRVRQGL
ncbi:MAG: pentapeptide repeat-containing protein [Vampirovibrionales bacterium]